MFIEVSETGSVGCKLQRSAAWIGRLFYSFVCDKFVETDFVEVNCRFFLFRWSWTSDRRRFNVNCYFYFCLSSLSFQRCKLKRELFNVRQTFLILATLKERNIDRILWKWKPTFVRLSVEWELLGIIFCRVPRCLTLIITNASAIRGWLLVKYEGIKLAFVLARGAIKPPPVAIFFSRRRTRVAYLASYLATSAYPRRVFTTARRGFINVVKLLSLLVR